jgi:NADH-quinone oxidoreductase subunit G
MNGQLLPTAPGAEAAALDALVEQGEFGIDRTAVILVGDRLATSPGALTAAVSLAKKTGARLAWVPRRAGDRGAVETGCLPTLLPGGRPVANASARVDAATAWGVESLSEAAGRDADAIVAALTAGELHGLVIGGVDPDDTADPAATRAAIEAASFVVALEIRETDVTRAADVVFPVAPVTDKAGTFVTWEGRPRPFEAIFADPTSLPDLRVLAGIAEALGTPLGFRTVADARAQMREMGPWDGERAALEPAAAAPSGGRADGLVLATWKQLLDNGSMQDGDVYMRATARRPVARVSRNVYDAVGPIVTITGDRGSVTLPAEATDDLVDGVVWVPANSIGNGVLADLASPGSRVTVKGADA